MPGVEAGRPAVVVSIILGTRDDRRCATAPPTKRGADAESPRLQPSSQSSQGRSAMNKWSGDESIEELDGAAARTEIDAGVVGQGEVRLSGPPRPRRRGHAGITEIRPPRDAGGRLER